jgi:hypothetical protein
MIDKADLTTFFNTEIVNTGRLAAIGNFGLKPVRYLFKGETITVERPKAILSVKPTFAPSYTERTYLKAAFACLALIPGLILALIKLFSYLFKDVRSCHQEVAAVKEDARSDETHTSVDCCL